MEKKEISLELPKESYEIGYAAGKIVAVIGQAIADGFQWTDIAEIVSKVYEETQEAVSGSTKIVEEFKEEPFKSSLALVVPITLGVEDMLKELKGEEE